jgi:hypothetical protein
VSGRARTRKLPQAEHHARRGRRDGQAFQDLFDAGDWKGEGRFDVAVVARVDLALTHQRDMCAPPAKLYGLCTIAHVEIDLPSSHLPAGVHDRVDAVICRRQSADPNHRPQRQHCGVRSNDPFCDNSTGGGDPSPAVRRRDEWSARAG